MFERIDDVFRQWEEIVKLPRGITTRQWVPEVVARLLEIPIELVSGNTFASKFAKGLGGFLLATIPQQVGPLMSREWALRDTEDVNAIAKFWMVEATDPTPEDLVKIAEALGNLRMGLTFGDWRYIARAFGVKSLDEISAEWRQVLEAFGRAFGLPSLPPAAPAPTSLPEQPKLVSIPALVEVPGFG